MIPEPAKERISEHELKKQILQTIHPDPTHQMVIEVTEVTVETDPHILVYEVIILDGRSGSWSESFATKELLFAFLRGIRATYAMSKLNRLCPDFGGEEPAPVKFTQRSMIDRLP